MVSVIYLKDRGIVAWLIRLLTLGKWNHCGIVDGDQVIHATYAKGVHISMVSDIGVNAIEICYVNFEANRRAIDFARKQIGKKYDLTALFGMFLDRDWEDADSWFCSELVEASLAQGGRKRFRSEINKITPQQSWSVL